MGSGGKGQQSVDVRASIPPGFRRGTRDFGRTIRNYIRDSRFQSGLSDTLDFYSSENLDPIRGVYDAAIADPTKLTDPLFLQQRERLGAELVERSRQTGGLYSSGANEMVGRGLGEFTNQYLNDAYQRQQSAAQGLMNFGQSLFTPFQAMAQPFTSVISSRQAAPPGQFGNPKGPLFEALGAVAGAAGASASYWGPLLAASDIRLKHSLRPYTWRWRDSAAPLGLRPNGESVGLIAQDVQRVWPDAVHASSDGYLRIDYALVAARLASLLQQRST